MTRFVGTQNRTEFILDPVQAWHRGRVLDHMLAAARLPVEHGVRRGSNRQFQTVDAVQREPAGLNALRPGLLLATALPEPLSRGGRPVC